jgi:hypothetical protein
MLTELSPQRDIDYLAEDQHLPDGKHLDPAVLG